MRAEAWSPPPLPPLAWSAIRLLRVRLRLARPLVSARSTRDQREVLLVHVAGGAAEGWAECGAEVEPTYDAEFAAGAALVIERHLVPRLVAEAELDVARVDRAFEAVRGHHMARTAVSGAVLDAQLRIAGTALAEWLGATAGAVPAGATVGSGGSVDDLVAEARGALGAGAARLRVKVAPGCAAERLRALREAVGAEVPVLADANGSFRADDPAHDAELDEMDEVGLSAIEQPFPPDDLLAHARLATRLATPLGLDESLGSLGSIDVAAAVHAARLACLKAVRLGGWPAARRAHDRCLAVGLEPWAGGMVETAVGRHGLAAFAALPGMAHVADLDPRPRFEHDLGPALRPGDDGLVPVPTAPGAAPAPDLSGHDVEELAAWHR